MLQENRLTGLFFLVGMFIGHCSYAVTALLAAIVRILTVWMLKFGPKLITMASIRH